MVRREAVGAAQHGQPAAHRVPDDTDVGARAVQSDQPVGDARFQDAPPLHSGADPGGPFDRIDLQFLQAPRGDEQSAVDRAVRAVPGGLDGYRQPAFRRPLHSGGDVLCVRGTKDDVGPVDGGDVERKRLFGEFGTVRDGHDAADGRGQGLDVVVD